LDLEALHAEIEVSEPQCGCILQIHESQNKSVKMDCGENFIEYELLVMTIITHELSKEKQLFIAIFHILGASRRHK
jgi:hypothetical protein